MKKQAIILSATFILALLLMGAVSATDDSCEEQLCVQFNNTPGTEIASTKGIALHQYSTLMWKDHPPMQPMQL
ncbi:MAG: hypothetical protein CIT03_08635 [Methanobacterium sp.]|nr:MAG: hypothetical protein CIT03_08635 [Methanobacterium sp.]